MKIPVSIMLGLLAGACEIDSQEREDNRRIASALHSAEPSADRIRISHYTSRDRKAFCGIAIIDGRQSSFYIGHGKVRMGEHDVEFAKVVHTPSIDQAPNKLEAGRRSMAKLGEILEMCAAEGLHLRPS
ncbi:hypothetical protein [Phenylobacterium sp.]|uniref:hypothetical protein n=1 Tax=Phenylobacterium sp. TaxID=1871053 RepID=UPI002730D059|nr:hypothetical protein [Phenylobacterium sp.]MDP1618454.1 hypothetical protein [Phenylobacterium sp.]MDP1988053.1 hypothetical protein [Phenylobacterium sp.]